MIDTINREPSFGEGPAAFDLGIIVSKFIWRWKLFVFCAILFLSFGIIYLKTSVPSYTINAEVLVEDEKKGVEDILGGGIMEKTANSFATKSNADNEIEIVKSAKIMGKVVHDLNLNIIYYKTGFLRNKEIFGSLPFQFNQISIDSKVRKVFSYKVDASGDGFVISDDSAKWTGKWNDFIQLPIGKFRIQKTDLFEPGKYIVNIGNEKTVAALFSKGLNAIVTNKLVSTISLSMDFELPEKGEVVLNKLIDVYIQSNIDDRKQMADSSLSFINERLGLIITELNGVEQTIETFKKQNDLTNITEQSRILLENTSTSSQQLNTQELQLTIIESLEKYLENQGNSSNLVPSSMILHDESFDNLVQKYNTLQSERSKLLMSTTEQNPYVKNLDQQLANSRTDIKANLNSIKKGIQVSVNQLQKYSGNLNQEMQKVPMRERVYLEYSRKQAIMQDLFVFLLKKREETAITQSSNVSAIKIVDRAVSNDRPTKPKSAVILSIALLIGFFVPSVWVYGKNVATKHIENKNDIKKLSNFSLLAEIGHNYRKTFIVQNDSVIAEQFRVLRSNLFSSMSAAEKTVLITSGIEGEGKSIISLNLANIIALTGKKVVLLEMDLRKPGISKKLNINNSLGISNYINKETSLDKIIVESGINPNLFILPAGTLPANPAELLLSPVVSNFFTILNEQFDYILIDTPPIEMVTDAQLLSSFADVNLCVLRQAYSYKNQIERLNEIFAKNKMKKPFFLFNDVRYVARYGYGSENQYYNADYKGFYKMSEKTNLWIKIKKVFNK